jgi:hypothetical protein
MNIISEQSNEKQHVVIGLQIKKYDGLEYFCVVKRP